ncbi:histidine phosphatase family protein [Polynucleobacter sp. JS-Mosq-20-D10]|uniref:histidine phosphatase family protein n=1 Tax=Polynucleobacter sp. JS-Mosq-20-D10 TaxID=2576922 RepID=UPI001BFDA584|nr:histidine phosphatase family protein [Polynucleobacter sp. JS-Mosq-20-D10]QWE00063.1 histidine phosphatase family protein [Polynucleobacter sp. JS-Mosq-20-D10]
MKRYLFFFLITCTLVFTQSKLATAQSELANKLNDGTHVLLMRHADAPGYGDPKNYQIGQCSTQRNLGDLGRKQAKNTGDWLSSQGIGQAKVYSSPWCRCVDTATLLNKGEVKKEAALGSFFDDMSLATKQTDELTKRIAVERKQFPSTPIIMVTHHVNIQSYVGVVVNSGDMVLVKVDPAGKPISFKLYPSP